MCNRIKATETCVCGHKRTIQAGAQHAEFSCLRIRMCADIFRAHVHTVFNTPKRLTAFDVHVACKPLKQPAHSPVPPLFSCGVLELSKYSCFPLLFGHFSAPRAGSSRHCLPFEETSTTAQKLPILPVVRGALLTVGQADETASPSRLRAGGTPGWCVEAFQDES